MTLAELQRYAASDRILNPDTIRAVLSHLSDMPAEQIFERVDPSYHPYDDLIDAVGISKDTSLSTAAVFVTIHQDTQHAVAHSHIGKPHIYASHLKALSLLSQLPSLYLPAIRVKKGDDDDA